MTQRVALAGFVHESNSFAPTPADYSAFRHGGGYLPLSRGAELLAADRGLNLPISGALAHADMAGWELAPILYAGAVPSAPVTRDAYDRITAEIVEGILAALPLDGVFLDLHGAMVAEHIDDGEGELLARIRAVVGPDVPIVAALDLHGNITRRMVEAADLLEGFRTYPHIDMNETGRRAMGGFGGSIRIRVPHPDHGRMPGVLVSGHMDTVHPVGVLAKNPWRVQDGKAWGPGIQDMKGGNFAMLEAARLIHAAGWQTPLPITFLFTPDEEVGTPATRALIEDEAKRNAAVLLPEPALKDGGAVTGRYAIARFNLKTEGRPSHAGWALKEGRSAIAEMARRILDIEALTTDDCTFSVGVIHAGQWVNCVPSSCDAELLSMAKTQADLDGGVAALMAMQGERNGVDFTVTRGVTRPVWEPGLPGTIRLYEMARDICGRLGFELTHESSGGGSDGNFTGALGIPTLDSIGLRGAGLHTLGEHIETESLIERARLAAALFMEING